MPNRKRKHTWKSAAAARLMQITGYPPTVEDAVQLIAKELMFGLDNIPTALEQIAQRTGFAESLGEQARQDDGIHDDGLRFFERPGTSTIQRRWEFAEHLAHHFFASMKPKGLTKGAELDRLCGMLAAELLLPTEAFREAFGSLLSLEHLLEVCTQFEVSIRLGARRLIGLPYVAIFEANQDKILWGYGGVRAVLLNNLEPDFRAIVQRTIEEDFVSPIRFFSAKKPWFGSRCVEWARPHLGKTLVLVRLPRRDETHRLTP